MNVKKFSDAISEFDTKYVNEALYYKKKVKKTGWIKWGVMAACVCMVAALIGLLSLTEQPNQPTYPISGGGNGHGFFNAKVLEVSDDTVSVECIDGMDSDFANGDIVSFKTEIVAAHGLPDIAPGDIVRIIYNNDTVEKDTLKIGIVFDVYFVDGENVLPNRFRTLEEATE